MQKDLAKSSLLAQIEIPYNGKSFFIDVADGSMIDLNRVHEIAGSPKNKEPKEWLKLKGTKNLIKTIKGDKTPFLKTRRGKGGGIWAHWQIALSYAQYLSPELHFTANQVFKERLEEIANPELGIVRSRERAKQTWKRTGKTEDWIAGREQGIDVHKYYIGTLFEHDVRAGIEIGACTNKIYKGLFNKDKNQIEKTIREKNSAERLPKNINIRDYAKLSSLAAITLAEALASEEIEEENHRGVESCANASYSNAKSVRQSLDDARSKRGINRSPEKTERGKVTKDAARKYLANMKNTLNKKGS